MGSCFLGPRLFLGHWGRAADLKNRSALHLLNSKDLRVEFLESAAKNLALPLRVNYAKDLALSIFKAMRDSSPPLLLRMTARSSFSAACLARRFKAFLTIPVSSRRGEKSGLTSRLLVRPFLGQAKSLPKLRICW